MSPVCEAKDTAVSCYSQIKHETVYRKPVPESLFPWQDANPPADFGQAYFGPYFEVDNSSVGYTSIPVDPHTLSTSEQDRWYGAPQESLMPYPLSNPLIQSPNPPGFSHGHLRPLDTYPSLARPILPLEMPQELHWADAMGAMATNEFTSNPPALEAYSYDATNHLTPAIYPTATGQYSTYEPDSRQAQDDFIEDVPSGGFETDYESKEKGPCYANLIYQALMEAPGHKMILKDIYAWFVQNTDKAKDPSSKGWQNSVRHNLSMNLDFVKVELTDPDTESKKGFIWVLEPSAVNKGIQPTTRYRLDKPGETKNVHRDGVDRRRERAGKRGGKVVKRSTRTRSLTRLDNTGDCRYLQSGETTSSLTSFTQPHELSVPSMDLGNSDCLPYWIPTPPLSTQSSPPLESYEFGATPESSESQPDYFLFDDAFGPDDGNMLGPNTSDIKCEDQFLGNGLDYLL